MVKYNIAVIGAAGHIGLPYSAVLATKGGHRVRGYDIAQGHIQNLQEGSVHIHEPGLDDRVKRALHDNTLSFHTDLDDVAQQSTIFYVCVPTPPGDGGRANTEYVEDVARSLGSSLKRVGQRDTLYIIVNKSTVPPGTGRRCQEIITQQFGLSGVEYVSCPEFMPEGDALKHLDNPDKIIVGMDPQSPYASRIMKIMEDVHEAFMRNTSRSKFLIENHLERRLDASGELRPMPISRETAEFGKYACNILLAARVALMNELRVLADKFGGVDMEIVRELAALDERIGSKFLLASPGFGGDCFPKDVDAMAADAQAMGLDLPFLAALNPSNDYMKQRASERVHSYFDGDLSDVEVSIWGLAFKAKTSDTRNSPSFEAVKGLLSAGAKRVKLYDVVTGAQARFRATLQKEGFYPHERITLCDSMDRAADADAIIQMVESDEFLNLPFDTLFSQRVKLFVDMRNAQKGHVEEIEAQGRTRYVGHGRHALPPDSL